MERPFSVLFAEEPVEVVFDEPYGQVLYFPRLHTVFVEMIASFSHEQYRQVYMVAYDALKRLQAKACVVSQSRSFGSSFQDRNWLITHLVPLLSQAFPTKEFLMIGIKDSENNTKRWIADYLERSFAAIAPFSVKSAPSFDDAIMLIKEAQHTRYCAITDKQM
jgi:hypothetical protein